MITRRIPWTEQPQDAVDVDWENPLSRGLVRLLVPINGFDFYDCATKETATRVGSAFATDYSRLGRAARTTATSGSYWTIPVRSEARNSMSVGRIGTLYTGGQTLIVRDATAAGGTILHWSNGGWDMRIGGTDYTAAGTHANNTAYVSLVTSSATAGKTFVGGQGLVINGGAPGASALVSPWQIHHNSGGSAALASTSLIAIWDRPLTDVEAAEWVFNPWQLFEPRVQRIWAPAAGGGGVTGTVAVTTAGDTSAASGTTTVSGTLARTTGADTSAASGTTTVAGTLAASTGADTAAASGAVGSGVSGSAAITTAGDTSAAAGTTTIVGSAASTAESDASSAAGWAGGIVGTVAVTSSSDTAVAAGTTAVDDGIFHATGGRGARRQESPAQRAQMLALHEVMAAEERDMRDVQDIIAALFAAEEFF